MNYLAHAFLSFNHDEILMGNMISDFVKGKKKLEFPLLVQKGIELHRAIDKFTDTHPSSLIAKSFFKPEYRLYSAAFVDVVYDHFLANDSNYFDEKKLMIFSLNVYGNLEKHKVIFPENFGFMFPYMQQDNWLYNYRFKWGIERSMKGLVRRARYLSDSGPAYKIFNDYYDQIHECYNTFMPDVYKMAKGLFDELTSPD